MQGRVSVQKHGEKIFMCHKAIINGLAEELKAKEPDKLTATERDFLDKWEEWSRRRGNC